jgi:hypothetical protein
LPAQQSQRKDWRPSAQQELLLQAALGEEPDSHMAWHEWRRTADIDGLDWGSRRLLPLVHHNAGEPQNPDTWVENQLLFQDTAALIRLLRQAGVEVLVLKGVPLALLYYRDAALRPMADVDLLVRPQDAARAINTMTEAGWTSPHPCPEHLIPFARAVDFRNANGTLCDLHWRAFRQGRHQEDDDLWKHAIGLEVADTATHTLDAADQLLLVCAHGSEWNVMPSLRWVADAAMLIRAGVDWRQVIERTTERRLMLPMADTLPYLQRFAVVPDDVVETIRRMPATRVERFDYRARTGPNATMHSVLLATFWARCWRGLPERRFGRKLMAFLRSLQSLWKVDYLWQTPFRLLYKCMQVSGRMIFRPSARHL